MTNHFTSPVSQDPAISRAANELFPPVFDPVASLAYLPEAIRNSWFLIGYLETASGHKLNVLVHQIIYTRPGDPAVIDSVLSVTDITERKYRSEELVHQGQEIELATDRMRIVTPSSTIEGDHRAISVKADFGWGALELHTTFPGHLMMNGGTGVFRFLANDLTAQYSIPWGQGTGWVTLDGVRHEASGTFWFDRQFGFVQDLFGVAGGSIDPQDRWIWMDINLSNGIVLGLWELERSGQRHSWVTALQPDGTHVVAALEPLADGMGGIWTSPETGWRYPTRFKIDVPALGCSLDVTSVMAEQEVRSTTEHRYEGVADVTGMYGGEAVTGFTQVELMGNWRP